jgi:acyl transferase domain-containing protein
MLLVESKQKTFSEKAALSAVRAASKPRTVFMYSGQGSQYYGMGRELYATHSGFRDALDACNTIYRDMSSRDMIAKLYDESCRWHDMTDIELSHPSLFAIGYALTAALRSDGVEADAVLGYSLGEYTASVASGALALADAMRIVIRQAGLFKNSGATGAMLSVLASPDHFEQQSELYRGTSVASINFAGNFVISGTAHAIEAVSRRLDAHAIASVRLPVVRSRIARFVLPVDPSSSVVASTA